MNKKSKFLSIVFAGALCLASQASPWSVPVKAVAKGCDKAAVKLGFRAAEKSAVRGGAKLAAVTAERKAAGSALQKVAKEVTAKKLLAGGAAVAIVSSAHEVSDGVQVGLQDIGSGVGEAVREHPDIAVDVLERITRPANILLFVCALVLVLAGLWLLRPILLVIANARRYRAIRRAAMQTGEVIDVPAGPAGPAEPAEPTNRSGFTRVETIFAIVGLAVLTIIGVWRMMPGKAKDPRGSGKPTIAATADSGKAEAEEKERIARRKAAVARMHAAYVEALERHHRAFLSEVEQAADSQFGRVRAGISGVVAKFGTFSRCKDLFKTIVVDRIKGGDRTGASIKSDLEADFYRGLYEARDRVHECLGSFLRNAESEREAFKVGLEAELDSAALPGDDAYKALLEECGERIEQKKGALKWGQIDAGIACVIEAVCIRQTVAAAARVLGNAAARQAGTMVAGGTAAVADGPLPVGDIIGGLAIVGCTAWSAWDIYKAAKVLPEELRSTLETVTRDCERQTLDEVKNAGETIYRAFSSENL